MNAVRFDTLAKMFTANPTRRDALRLLLGVGLGSYPLGAAARKRKKRRKKRKPRPLCPAEPFVRCATPAGRTFLAALERCAPQCGDRNSAVCQSCLEPDVAAAVAAVEVCTEDVCRGGAGESDAGSEQAARGAHLVAAASSCNSTELRKCLQRKNGSFGTCLFATGNWREIVACIAQNHADHKECLEDHGCKGGGYCIQNTCCPGYRDTVCNGACCSHDRCQECVGGACVGCKPPARCGSTPLGRRCVCPSLAQAPCGRECCDPNRCQQCVEGACRSKCQRPKICRGSPGTCQCPPGASECGDSCCCPDGETLCEEAEACVDTRTNPFHCGRCGGACPAGEPCVDGECRSQCPAPESAPASLRRPPDRRAVQGQGIGGPCHGIPPCVWPEVGQECCDEPNGYVCTANKVCCRPGYEACGGSPKSWGCCCDTAAGEVCNPNFDNTSGSECCPCKDGGVRCVGVCCKPGERCDFVTLRCVPCSSG